MLPDEWVPDFESSVVEKTARRDIAELRKRELIEFVGAPKAGHYRLRLRKESDNDRA